MSENTGYKLEREVAAIYRALGAKVEHDVSMAGNQIDIFVTEQTSSGTIVKYAIECKAYSRPVGIDVINSFCAISYLLKNRGLIDKAVLISTNGFTHQARTSAREHNVELLELSDLLQRVRGCEEEFKRAQHEFEYDIQIPSENSSGPKRIFVTLPSKRREFDDVYIYGIRAVAEKLGLVAERADDMQNLENIQEEIQYRLRSYELVVADTTYWDISVMYNIGYAHGAKTKTLIINRADERVPMDLIAVRCIIYETVDDLREKLEEKLAQVLMS
jgi:hypothetical protein